MLPVVCLYGIIVWILCGLIEQHWWIQFACFAVSSFLMIILNNQNALIRIYSRSITAAFIILSCTACFLFPNIQGAIVQLCIIASLILLYQTYQDRQSVGLCFYTFLVLGVGSLLDVRTLWFVPIYWIFIALFVYSLSFKTFLSSLLGILLPYWCVSAWLLWKGNGDFSYFHDHFVPLAKFALHVAYTTISPLHIAVLAFIMILAITGSVHFLRTSYNDKIRTRQIYYSLMFLNAFALFFLILQPQTEDIMLRVIILTTCPLIGHFISLTYTRITNIAFCIILAVSLILTILSVWTSSLIF